MSQQDKISVWEGHHPKPEGPTIMGVRWLCNHFDSVYNHQYEIIKNIDSVYTFLIGATIAQAIVNGIILWKLYRI